MFKITKDTTFKAIYSTNTYSVSVGVSGGNGGTLLSASTVTHGGSVKITFIPDYGYEVDTVKVGGSIVTVSGLSHTISNITTDTVVEVTFRIKTYNINISVNGGNGSASASPTVVNQNGSTTITLAPNSGYEVDKVTVNGSIVIPTLNTVIINSITSDVTVVITFKMLPKVITWCFQKNSSGGTVTTTDITSLELTACGNVPTGLHNGMTVLAAKVNGTICSFTNFSRDYTITSENSSIAGIQELINGVLGTYSSTFMCRGKKAGTTAFVITDKVTNISYRLPVTVRVPDLKLLTYGYGDITSDLTSKDAIPKSAYNRSILRVAQEVLNLSNYEDVTYTSDGKTYSNSYDEDAKLTVVSNNNSAVEFSMGPAMIDSRVEAFSNTAGSFIATLKVTTCGTSVTSTINGKVV